MAKLSDAQKHANKLARKTRDGLYQARRRARNFAESKVDDMKAKLPENAAVAAAEAQLNELMADRARRRDELNEQIAKLQEDLKKVDAEFAAVIEPARQVRRDAWSAANAAGRMLDEQLDAQFPDLVGVWGPASWRQELVPADATPQA